jgi:hypothetical protein
MNWREETAMSDIVEKIMAEFESDPTINAKNLNLLLTSRGIIKRRQTLNVFGSVGSTAEKDKIVRIVNRQAGTRYDVADKIVVT